MEEEEAEEEAEEGGLPTALPSPISERDWPWLFLCE